MRAHDFGGKRRGIGPRLLEIRGTSGRRAGAASVPQAMTRSQVLPRDKTRRES